MRRSAIGDSIPGPPERCGAKNRQGVPCRQWPTKGKKRCKFHGGESIGGGAPPGNKHGYKHGLYVGVLADEDRDVWAAVDLGNLDDEIRLARTQLHAYLRTHGLNVTDGLRVGYSDGERTNSERWEPHVSIVLKHLDKIRRLEVDRAAMLRENPPPPDGLEDYRAWLEASRSRLAASQSEGS